MSSIVLDVYKNNLYKSEETSEVKKVFFTLNYKFFFTKNKNCYKIQITKHRIINQGFIGYIGIYMH